VSDQAGSDCFVAVASFGVAPTIPEGAAFCFIGCSETVHDLSLVFFGLSVRNVAVMVIGSWAGMVVGLIVVVVTRE